MGTARLTLLFHFGSLTVVPAQRLVVQRLGGDLQFRAILYLCHANFMYLIVQLHE